MSDKEWYEVHFDYCPKKVKCDEPYTTAPQVVAHYKAEGWGFNSDTKPMKCPKCRAGGEK